MAVLTDDDGTPLRRERTGELVPERDTAKPCTPAETRIDTNRLRAMLQEAHSA